ncbi:MAG: hypothetical protein AB8B88_00880 [Devosiaceae bacterium]
MLGLIACRLVWVRAVRLTRARLERDRPETLRAFEARIAGAQARAAISIRELERALERERQISAQARLMADQMGSSSALALAERDDTQSSLINLSDTLNGTRERLRDHEETLVQRNNDIADLRRDLVDVRQELAMRDDDLNRMTGEADALRAELAAHMVGNSDPASVKELAQSGDAAAMARTQIESLRETVRSLRAEKNAAEASAARARLLLDAREDNQVIAAAKADFEAQRKGMEARISQLEAELQNAPRRTGPQLVDLGALGSADAPALATPSTEVSQATDLDSLRNSIDAMTASLTATAASATGGNDRINALLDEAEEEGADSNLVTSLVEARNRLRSKKATPKSPRKSAVSTRGKTGDGQTKTDSKTKSANAKLVAATASGTSSEKAGGMPRASESDLKVI